MKKVIYFLMITFAVSVPFYPKGEQSTESIKTEVKKILDLSVEGWNSGNLEDYMQCYLKSESMRFVGNNSFNMGWINTLNRYKKSYPDKKSMGILSFSDIDITVISSDAVLVFGRWTLSYKDRKKTGLYTLLLRKFEQGWKIVHDHSSG